MLKATLKKLVTLLKSNGCFQNPLNFPSEQLSSSLCLCAHRRKFNPDELLLWTVMARLELETSRFNVIQA